MRSKDKDRSRASGFGDCGTSANSGTTTDLSLDEVIEILKRDAHHLSTKNARKSFLAQNGGSLAIARWFLKDPLMMKFFQLLIILVVVSVIVVILLIDPHSGDEHARAPGAIIIGFLVLCVTIIITRPKPVQEFIREKEAIIASLLSFGIFGWLHLLLKVYSLEFLLHFCFSIAWCQDCWKFCGNSHWIESENYQGLYKERSNVRWRKIQPCRNRWPNTTTLYETHKRKLQWPPTYQNYLS